MLERRAHRLLDHVLEVFVGGYGDESVEVLVGKLVLKDEGAVVEQRLGEVGAEGGDRGQLAVPHYDDAGVAADVAEGLVVRAGDDVAAVAAHEPQLRSEGGRPSRRRWRLHLVLRRFRDGRN